MKDKTGGPAFPVELYRPSNGTEGECFMDSFCYTCQFFNDEWGCPIEMFTMAFDNKAPEYPNQWRYDNGKPVCIAYIERQKEPKE